MSSQPIIAAQYACPGNLNPAQGVADSSCVGAPSARAEFDKERARLLVIDDQEANVLLLRKILSSAGYQNVVGLTDPRRAEAVFAETEPDLVLLDLHMPYLGGLEVLRLLSSKTEPGEYLPIVVLTADANPESKQACLAGGAKDFLTKPFDAQEVLLRIRNMLETRFLHVELRSHNRTLESQVRVRTWELEQARNEVIERLAVAAEYRDDATGAHIQRVGKLATAVAAAMGLPESDVELIARTVPLHDVGKIGVPDGILLKPGRLTAEEFERVKVHTTIGAQILAGDQFPLLRMAQRIALTHHERWDGTGYPRGLAGEVIPIEGRIVSVSDVFDALVQERPYKRAWPFEEAVAEIEGQRGRQFDPDVVQAFLGVVEPPAEESRGA
jgi:response regulator RpfG family c-di-GMP phosphodiesterase